MKPKHSTLERSRSRDLKSYEATYDTVVPYSQQEREEEIRIGRSYGHH